MSIGWERHARFRPVRRGWATPRSQAVFARFVHSRPVGQKSAIRDPAILLGPTRPDEIGRGNALLPWVDAL